MSYDTSKKGKYITRPIEIVKNHSKPLNVVTISSRRVKKTTVQSDAENIKKNHNIHSFIQHRTQQRPVLLGLIYDI